MPCKAKAERPAPSGASRRGRRSQADHIEVNAKVMLGKPVIRGTRIPVELILRKLGEGASEADLLDGYPRLKLEHIRAALVYAGRAQAQRWAEQAARLAAAL